VRPAGDEIPHRWEMGTQSHEALAGLVAAVDYLAALGARLDAAGPSRPQQLRHAMEGIRQYEKDLARRLVEGVERLPARLWGPPANAGVEGRVPTVCLTSPRQPPSALAAALGELGIYAWDGNYYALGVMERLGLHPEQGALRLGAVHYNSAAEVDAALETLADLLRR
jgi:selenocysteine lyase/cysteine desulfurase